MATLIVARDAVHSRACSFVCPAEDVCVFVVVQPLSLHIVHRMAEAYFLINSSLLQNWSVSTVEDAPRVNTTKSVPSLPPSVFRSSR